jgi:hypothetical protein
MPLDALPSPVLHRCYLTCVPTSRKRHTITETPRVEAALEELREAAPGDRIDLGELVVLGAARKLEERRAGAQRRDALLDDLAERVRRGDLGVDPDAAEEVRRSGWARG